MERRTLIRGLVAGLATCAALPGCRPTPPAVRDFPALALLATGLETAEIDAITRATREANPEPDWRALLPPVAGLAWHDDGAASDLDDAGLGAALRAVAGDQYRHHRFRVMAGWVLSDLECALCALR